MPPLQSLPKKGRSVAKIILITLAVIFGVIAVVFAGCLVLIYNN